MKFTLFHSGQTGNPKTTIYPHSTIITDKQTLKQTVAYDHVAASFTNYTRTSANFISSDVLVMDIDNSHSEDPEKWVTQELLEDLFDDYQFALVTSRNHMTSKSGETPRPRYHIYFVIEAVSDTSVYVQMKEELINRYGFFDDNAKDAARFFFGHGGSQVVWHDSWLTIDDLLLEEVAEEEDFDKDFYTPPNGPITQGSRNSTMSVFAAKVLKRYGITKEAKDAFDQQAQKCDPPLDKAELNTIWGSAVRFFNRTIKTSEGYVSPEVFNRPSLKPDDYSDIGEAGVLAREYGEKLAYTNATDYLTFDGRYWREDKQRAVGAVVEFLDSQLEDATRAFETAVQELVKTGIKETVVRAGGKGLTNELSTPLQFNLYQSYVVAQNYVKFVMKRRDYKYIMATYNTAKPMLAISLSELDKNDLLLNTPEATYDLSQGLSGQKPHDSLDYMTKMTTVSPSDKGKGIWQEALATFFCGDQDLMDYVQQVVGMAAIGKVYQEHLIIAYGGGANGKSTFWNTIARVLGNYSGKISAEALTMSNKRNIKPEMAELKGKRLIIASEMDEGMRLNTGVVKQLCSTDEIYAEKKYKDPFQFVPSHTLVLYTNHLPKVGANDDGIWRRLIVIPFNAKIKGRSDIKNYADYLFEHAAPAILTWMIEGAEKAIKANFKTKLPKVVEDSIKDYREANDWLGHFIEDCCQKVNGYRQKSGELYSAYRAYAMKNGEYTRSTTDFYRALEAAGFHKQRTSKFNAIVGLQLLEEDFLD